MLLNPTDSWSVNFAKEWWPYLSPISILRWRDTVLRAEAGVIHDDHRVVLKFKSPVRANVTLRGATSDTYTLQEIMVRQVYAGLRRWMPDCRTVIDLGSNIGLASLYFGATYPRCRVLAVEPHWENVEMLQRNLEPLIRGERARILQAAVWSRAADLEFRAFANAGAFDSVRVCEAFELDGDGSVVVPGMPMTSIIEQSGFREVDVLKVDIEGAEVELLQGDLSWLRRVKCIAIEFHGDARERSGFDGIMQTYGFSIVDENDHTVLALAKRS